MWVYATERFLCHHILLSKILFIYGWSNPGTESPSRRRDGCAENWPGTLSRCPSCPLWWPLSRQMGKGQTERSEEWLFHLPFLLGFRARTWSQGWPFWFLSSAIGYLPSTAQNTVCRDNGCLASANCKDAQSYGIPATHTPSPPVPAARKLVE